MPFHRGRRLRATPGIRALVRETRLHASDFIQPYFVVETDDAVFEKPISSMPGQSQLSINKLVERVGAATQRGLAGCILFGIPKAKNPSGSGAYDDNGIIQQAIRALKDAHPELTVITDVCLCEYTSHGHCGLIQGETVLNDPTLELLAQTAVSHVRAGADIVAPSDMMDGRVAAIRQGLNAEGFQDTPILSYAVKYASSFYGPFREAAEGAPSFGDRSTYQMDPANRREGLIEAAADLGEGADMLMVKPAGPYLDVLRDLRESFDCPLAAYHVSGEFAMLKSAAANGWLDERKAVLETMVAFKRAGADFVLTYYAEDLLGWLED